jgi:tripartite-type tricarboxylate transporter receptor subunit TctC
MRTASDSQGSRCQWAFGMVVMLTSAAGLAPAALAQVESFPSKPLRIIVPFPPGGAGDISNRILAESMSKGLGKPVMIDNRPGGGAVIGYELGARAAGDGHTMVAVLPSFLINPAVRPGLSYDPFRDFKAIGQAVWAPLMLAVHPSLPAKSVQELVALALRRPGELAYATAGVGTNLHLVGEMFRLAANLELVHVAYKGAGPAATDLVAGHIPMAVTAAVALGPFIKAGKVRPLAVTTAQRVEAFPSVPTLRESGYAIEETNWIGLVAPAATPDWAILRLNAEVVRSVADADVQARLRGHALYPLSGTPAQFAAFLQSQGAKYARVVKEAGIRAD